MKRQNGLWGRRSLAWKCSKHLGHEWHILKDTMDKYIIIFIWSNNNNKQLYWTLNLELNTEIQESGSRQKDNRLQLWFWKCLGMLKQKASDYNTLAITYALAPRSSPLPVSSLRLYCREPATLCSLCSSQVAVLSMYLLESSCIGHSGPINS